MIGTGLISIARPQDTLPPEVWTSQVHSFELGAKNLGPRILHIHFDFFRAQFSRYTVLSRNQKQLVIFFIMLKLKLPSLTNFNVESALGCKIPPSLAFLKDFINKGF